MRHGTSLREAIWIIIVADVTMSLDNVLAVAAAAHGDLLLVVFGIALSLPLVVWGSGYPVPPHGALRWIIWIGGGVLGYVAGEMMTDDPVVRGWLAGPCRRRRRPRLDPARRAVAPLGWWLARGAAAARRSRGAYGA